MARLRRMALAGPQIVGAAIGTVGFTVLAFVWHTWLVILGAAVLWVVGVSVFRESWRKAADDG